MHLPRFDHIHAESVDDAIRLLKAHGVRARLVAGGTDLFPRMKYGLVHPGMIISLRSIPVTPPTVNHNGDLHLDPLMSLADVARSPLVRQRAPVLAEAALRVGSNQLRHMGTLGGNVCLENRCLYYNQSHTFQFVEPCFKRAGTHCDLVPGGKKCLAVFSADTVPPLISLGALIRIRGPETSRQLPLERLYTADALRPLEIGGSEVVDDVVIPNQTSKQGTAFVKFGLREALEFAIFNIAVVLNMDENGNRCHDARITVGAVWAAPIRMTEAEEILRGCILSEALFDQVTLEVASRIHPHPGHVLPAAYIRECLKIHTGRALRSAVKNLPQHASLGQDR